MPKKILIVEDNKKNRVLIGDILRYHGYEVMEAEDGQEGVRMARAHMPDLIMMDMQMPVMDGFEAIKILKKASRTKDIKIIAVTSFAMKGDRERILEEGADDYVAKPLNTRELPYVVKRLLREEVNAFSLEAVE